MRGLGLQVSNFSNSVGRGVGARDAGKLEPCSRGVGPAKRGSSGFRAARLGLGALRAAFSPAARSLRVRLSGVLARPGSERLGCPRGTRGPAYRRGTVE